jgi:hypothetical protein
MWRVEILFRGRWCPVVIVLLCRIWHSAAVAVPRPWWSILSVVYRYRSLPWIARLPAHIPPYPVVHNSNSRNNRQTSRKAVRVPSSTLLYGKNPIVYHYKHQCNSHLHIKISDILSALPADQQRQPCDRICQEVLHPLHYFVLAVHLVREDHHVPQQPSGLLFQLYSTSAT